MFWLGLSAGVIGCASAYFTVWVSWKFLNKSEFQPTIGVARPAQLRSSGKRVPRANTDLMAYQKEIQEQGENRV